MAISQWLWLPDIVSTSRTISGPSSVLGADFTGDGRIDIAGIQQEGRVIVLRNGRIAADVIIGDNQQGIQTVSRARQAIGYVSIGSAEYEAENGAAIRLIPVDDQIPTTAAVAPMMPTDANVMNENSWP